jgi:hypothetical protein
MRLPMTKAVPVSLLFFSLTPFASAQTLVLQQKFIAKYHNRATVEGNFIVDHAHPQPNPPSQDGDLHAAGRSDAVGLPMVSEVMNAAGATQQAIVNAIHANEGTGKAVPIAGAWRIWFEHPSKAPQVQGATVPPAANTNPNHCFEIHPITVYSGQAVPDSLQPINGYTPKDPDTAFKEYEKLSTTIQIAANTVTLTSKQVGYNYVKFTAQLAGKPDNLDPNDEGQSDGQVVLANILGSEGDNVLVNNLRLIFVAGTLPAKTLQSAPAGATLELLAIPRVDLNAIWTFMQQSGTGTVTRKLPYEMIVVGVFSGANSANASTNAPKRSTRQRDGS